MEIQAYNPIYLPDVAENLGEMFEHITSVGVDYNIFWNTFINSDVAKQIEKGNPKYLSCSSLDYLIEIYKNKIEIPRELNLTFNKYYWAGWALAQLQQKTGYTFYRINKFLPIDEVLRLHILHEADITKFIDIARGYFKNKDEMTNLKKARTSMGLSQIELSKITGVNIRSIQMYEQRHHDINKAQAGTLLKFAKVFGCKIEELLEY